MIERVLYEKKDDIVFLLLFLLHLLPFLEHGINNSALLIVTALLMTYLAFSKGRHHFIQPLELLIVIGCLSLNCLLSDGGIGSLLGYWELYMLLLVCPHLKLSSSTFSIIYCLSFVIVCWYSYRIITHPALLLPSTEESVNANQVGLFEFYMASITCLLCPRFSVKNIVLLVLTYLMAFPLIWLSQCRSAQMALFMPLLGLGIVLMMSSWRNKLVGIFRIILPFFVWGGSVIVILSLINLQDLLSVIGDLSNSLGNKKGATLSARSILWKQGLDYFYESPVWGAGSKIRLKSWHGDSLALHSSAMNLLVVYGFLIFLITYRKIQSMLLTINGFIIDYPKLIMSLLFFIGVLITSFFESTLMDYFKFFSFFPIAFAFSYINAKSDNLDFE